MLTVKCVRRLGQAPVVIKDSSTVIVEDNYGNPVAVIVHINQNACTVVTPDDPDFNRILQGLGVDKIVINEQLNLNQSNTGGKLIGGPGALLHDIK